MCSTVRTSTSSSAGRTGEVREALRARDGDVQPVPRHEEVDPARRVRAGRGRHREEDDRRLLTLELVDRPDRDALRAAAPARSLTCALNGATTMTSPRRDRPRRRRSESVHVPAEQPLDLRADSLRLLLGRGRVPHVRDRQPAEAGAERARLRVARRRPSAAGPRRTRRRCNRQTSGCMRNERSRKRPMSSATVARSPSRCASTERPASPGCTPCVTCASCTGSPSSTIVFAHVPSASASASEVWPASSTKR